MDQQTKQIQGLEEQQWMILGKAIREYILSHEKEPLERALQELVNEVVHSGAMSFEQMKRCIYAFYETVSLGPATIFSFLYFWLTVNDVFFLFSQQKY